MVSSISGVNSSAYVSQLQNLAAPDTTKANFNISTDVKVAATTTKDIAAPITAPAPRASSNVALPPEILSLLQETSSADPLAALLGVDKKSESQPIVAQLLEKSSTTSAESLLVAASSTKLAALAYKQAFSTSQ